jgi:hypothetical protein
METNLSELKKSYLDSEVRKYFGDDIEYKILEDQSLSIKPARKKTLSVNLKTDRSLKVEES